MTQQYTPPDFLLAQESHFSIAAMCTFAAKALGFPAWYGAALILIVALAKELTFDVYKEHQPFFGPVKNSGFVDWLFYLAGVTVAAVLLALAFGLPGLALAP